MDWLCKVTNIKLSDVTNIITIIGVVFAIFAYFWWKRDYKQQKSHEYALTLMKKIKELHMDIESLRGPKFFDPKTIIEDMRISFFPSIKEKIFSKVLEINSELLIADQILMRHNNLQSEFNDKIVKKIISPIDSGMYYFLYQSNELDFNIKETEIWKIIFPLESIDFEFNEPGRVFKKSILGTQREVVNDKFNMEIECNFNAIYQVLEDNLVMDSKKKYG